MSLRPVSCRSRPEVFKMLGRELEECDRVRDTVSRSPQYTLSELEERCFRQSQR